MTPYILNIHTATETAIVNLSAGPRTLHTIINADTKQHAAFLHPAIDDILKKGGIGIKNLNAIGITSGPGSYTGMRVGLAAAKGLCYALNIPLITYNSLELIALSTIDFLKDNNALYCPMIDARRMEVYTALYRFNMDEVAPPSAKILDENSFSEYSNTAKIIFSGSGSKKFQDLSTIAGAYFTDIDVSTNAITSISWGKYQESKYSNISFIQPLYIKEFYSSSKERIF